MKYRRWFVCSKGPYIFRKQALKILYDRDCFLCEKSCKKTLVNLGLLSYRGIFTPFIQLHTCPCQSLGVTYSSHIEGIFPHTAFEEQKKKSLNCKEIFKIFDINFLYFCNFLKSNFTTFQKMCHVKKPFPHLHHTYSKSPFRYIRNKFEQRVYHLQVRQVIV